MSTDERSKLARFSQLIELLGYPDVQKFARAIGVAPQTVRSQIGRARFNEEVLTEISARGGNVNWLLTGRGEPMGSSAEASDPGVMLVPINEVQVSAGGGDVELGEEEVGKFPFDEAYFRERIGAKPGNVVMLKVSGDSMAPTLGPGELVMVDTGNDRPPSDGVWVVRIGNALLVKRLQVLPGGRIAVISDNPAYQPYEIDTTEEQPDFAIIGRVVWAPRLF